MLPSVSSLKTAAIASAVALAIGFSSGVWVRDAFCDAAAAKRDLATANAAIRTLQSRIDAAQKASAAHDQRAAADAVIDQTNQEAVDATPGDSHACLDRDAARRVRGID